MVLRERGRSSMQASPDAHGSQYSPPGMVLMGNGRAEQGHDAVPQELIDRALIVVHFAQDKREELVEQRVHGLRTKARGKGSGVGQVAKEHGDLLALPFEGGTGGKNFFG
jgi:hypothetical protein